MACLERSLLVQNEDTAVLGRDVNWETLFTCLHIAPSYFMFSTVAHTDTNFLPKVTGKQCYILVLLSQTCPVVSRARELPRYRLLQLSHKLPPLLYPSCKTGWMF